MCIGPALGPAEAGGDLRQVVEDDDQEVDETDGGQDPGRELVVGEGVSVVREERDEGDPQAQEEIDGDMKDAEGCPGLGARDHEEEVHEYEDNAGRDECVG